MENIKTPFLTTPVEIKPLDEYPTLAEAVEQNPPADVKKFEHNDETGEVTVSTDAETTAAIEELSDQLALDESTCGCENCIEKEGGDDFAMLYDMFEQLTSRVEELENRIALHNVKASHKI